MSTLTRQDIVCVAGRASSVTLIVTGQTFQSNNPTFVAASAPGGDVIKTATVGGGLTIVNDTTVTVVIDDSDFSEAGLYWYSLYTVLGEASRGRIVVRPSPIPA